MDEPKSKKDLVIKYIGAYQVLLPSGKRLNPGEITLEVPIDEAKKRDDFDVIEKGSEK